MPAQDSEPFNNQEWTGEQIHRLHKASGGPYTWNELEEITGLPRHKLRRLATNYRKKIGFKTTQGQRKHVNTERDTFEQTGPNTAQGSATFPFPATIEDLVAYLKVDTAVWEVERWGYSAYRKQWEGYGKIEAKDLCYTNGVVDGWVRSEGLQTVPLHGEGSKIWAAFRRINPLPTFPTIRPIECKTTYRKPPRPSGDGVKRSLIWADPHFGFSRDVPSARLVPFHDRRALDIVLQLAAFIQPDRIDVLGDWFDFVMWTDKFLRSPKFEYTTQPAICEGHWHLRQLREACPDAAITLHEGNHDARMKAAIMTHLRAAYGLKAADEMDLPPAMSPQKLLGVDGLGIVWVDSYPDGDDWLNDEVRLSHGQVARGGQGDTAKAVVLDADTSEIFGHIHRLEWVSRTRYTRGDSMPLVGFCPGCVCHIDGRVPGKKSRQQWQQGCAVVDYAAGDGKKQFSISPILIDNGRALWNGRTFEARDRVGDLMKDLPDWNW